MSRYGYGAHSFLIEYIRRNGCKRIMEIGVAEGKNALSMMEAASENFPSKEVEYYGFDTFRWNNEMDIKQKLENTGCQIRVFKGDSAKTLPENMKKLPLMDLIFIDGGHSYLTVKSDWENSKQLMHDETAVFFHNYDFSGPKRVVDAIPRDEYMVKIIDPPWDSKTARIKKRLNM